MKSTINIFFIFLLTFFNNVFSQEYKSIHQADKETFGLSTKQPSLFNPDGKDIIPLNTSKTSGLSHTIFGYLPDWEYKYRSYLRYDLVTHIGCFDFVVASNGNITNPSFWPWTDIINSAHNNGVKVIMVAVNFKPIEQRNIIKNSTARQNFFNNVKSIIQTFNLDGVNIDFEGLYTSIRGDTLNWFLADLTNFIHTNLPGKEVSFAGPA
ncbi:MAG: hypothetical protein JW866_10750, partial [Ignavibacteriales bacterium]|nr:hypothetical protein [Ignavibacteriales bacterium]